MRHRMQAADDHQMACRMGFRPSGGPDSSTLRHTGDRLQSFDLASSYSHRICMQVLSLMLNKRHDFHHDRICLQAPGCKITAGRVPQCWSLWLSNGHQRWLCFLSLSRYLLLSCWLAGLLARLGCMDAMPCPLCQMWDTSSRAAGSHVHTAG